MSSSGGATVHAGTPPSDFGTWATTEVCFHKFADLPTTKDEGVISPQFTCFGHNWKVEIYPGGSDRSKKGYVGVALMHMSANGSISVAFSLSVRDSTGKEVAYELSIGPNTFDPYNEEQDIVHSWGLLNFAKYSTMIMLL